MRCLQKDAGATGASIQIKHTRIDVSSSSLRGLLSCHIPLRTRLTDWKSICICCLFATLSQSCAVQPTPPRWCITALLAHLRAPGTMRSFTIAF